MCWGNPVLGVEEAMLSIGLPTLGADGADNFMDGRFGANHQDKNQCESGCSVRFEYFAVET